MSQNFIPTGSDQPVPFAEFAGGPPREVINPPRDPPGSKRLIRPGVLSQIKKHSEQAGLPTRYSSAPATSQRGTSGLFSKILAKRAQANRSTRTTDAYNYNVEASEPPSQEAEAPPESEAVLIENVPFMEIESFSFSIYTKEELINMGAVVIDNLNPSGNGSLFDERMGVDNPRGFINDVGEVTTGVPGMIVLQRPFYHPGLMTLLVQILNSICPYHSSLLLDVDYLREELKTVSNFNRLSTISVLSSSVVFREKSDRCPGARRGETGIELKPLEVRSVCGCTSIRVLRKQSVDTGVIHFVYRSEEKKVKGPSGTIPINDVKLILDKLARNKEAMEILGFSDTADPSRVVMEALYVIPPIFRPSNIVDGQKKDHPFTGIYRTIIQNNDNLKRGERVQESIKNIYAALNRLMTQKRDERLRYGQETSSIKETMGNKRGLFIRNALAKRSSSTARSPITPAYMLDYGWMGVPSALRSILSKPEYVTQYNIKYLQELADRREIIYYTVSPGTIFESRNHYRPGLRLKVGWLVERKLTDGDFIVANRQPSLYKYSLMAHLVKLHPGLSLMLHIGATAMYNADFDGDEMTIFNPRGSFSRAEAEVLMNVGENFLGHHTNAPVAGALYDAVPAVTKLTLPGSMVDVITFQNCMMILSDIPERYFERLMASGIPPLSGHALFSLLLPADFNPPVSGDVVIQNGILIKGVLTKKHIGVGGNIVHHLFGSYSPRRARQFITDASHMLNVYFEYYPLSVGLGDCFFRGTRVTEEKEVEIDGRREVVKVRTLRHEIYLREIRRRYKTFERLIRDMSFPSDNPIMRTHIENKIMYEIRGFQDDVYALTSEFLSEEVDSAFNIMLKSMAKGSLVHLTQIMGMLGQQFLQNSRPQPRREYEEHRCLPFYLWNKSSDLEDRGMCPGPFISGLSPKYFFIHMMHGREGLLDTNLKTVDAGTIEKLIGMALGNFVAREDASVRNPDNTIFQYLYGNDGVSPKYKERLGRSNFGSPFHLEGLVTRLNAKAGYVPGTY